MKSIYIFGVWRTNTAYGLYLTGQTRLLTLCTGPILTLREGQKPPIFEVQNRGKNPLRRGVFDPYFEPLNWGLILPSEIAISRSKRGLGAVSGFFEQNAKKQRLSTKMGGKQRFEAVFNAKTQKFDCFDVKNCKKTTSER